ncbi:restriction endonuclease subunit S [Helicobacter winghamensis]|uniref:restriction endonuclease subunit S n=1 Tax=Helicobacter winghamensis TaxID=157268 RepID=UPI0027AB723C
MRATREREQTELKEILREIESLLLQKAFLQNLITQILQKVETPANLESLLDSIPTPPPHGWEVKTLGEICEINPKIDFKELTKLEREVSFLPMEAVKTDGRTFEKFQRKAKEAQGFTKFADNDLLWAKITPCMQNKKSLVVNGLKNGFGFGSTEFFVLRSKDSRQINIHFILQFLRLDLILQNASETFKGSAGQQRVPKEFLQNLKIPLPPFIRARKNPSPYTQDRI